MYINNSFNSNDFYPFKRKQLNFLYELSKDLDMVRALKAAGYSPSVQYKFLDETTPVGQAMLCEMQRIYESWFKSIRLNAHSCAAKHVELMQKFEDDYNEMDRDNRNKGSLASTLAKMSDTAMKATGHFTKDHNNDGAKVEINIDLSSNATFV